MNDRQRFKAVMDYGAPDRLPRYIFGYWNETLARWREEGLDPQRDIFAQLGLDPDWEGDIWRHRGMLNVWRCCDRPSETIEETDDWALIRNGFGDVIRHSKRNSSLDQHLEYGFEPTRRYWREVLRPSFDPRSAGRDLAAEGGYLPIPDHRIPPEVSLAAMRRYVEIFREIFN